MRRVFLPIKTVAGLNAREHWRKRCKRVSSERSAAHLIVREIARKVPMPVTVTLVRASVGTLDSDNLQGALKGIRDGVADAYGVDDNGLDIRWQYGQTKCKRGGHGVYIDIAPRIVETVDEALAIVAAIKAGAL